MWQVKEKRGIFSAWVSWHYFNALGEIYARWRDLLLFNLNYFSIPFLLRTLFAPWRKYRLSYGKGFDIGRAAEILVFNAFSRVTGMILRILVIFFGIISQTLFFLGGAIFVAVWIILPLLTVWGLLTSLQWLISI